MNSPVSDAEPYLATELVDVSGMPLVELRSSRDTEVVRSLRHVVARSAQVGISIVSSDQNFDNDN